MIEGIPAATGPAQGAAGDARLREQQRLKEACEEFEAFFMREILKGLKTTTGMSAGALGGAGSAGSGIQMGLADDQFAVWLSRSGGIGLGKALYDSLVKGLEAGPAIPGPGR